MVWPPVTHQDVQDEVTALRGRSDLKFFDVTSYGAVGNDSTDCTAAINSALSAASAAGGGIVFFPRGNYRTQGGHVIPAYVHILGSEPASRYWGWSSATPPSSCSLRLNATSATAMFLFDTTAKASSVRDITLAGRNLGTGIHGITFAKPATEHNIILDNMAIIGFTGDGIRGEIFAQRWHQIFVGGCHGWGWHVNGTDQWTDMFVTDCYVVGNKTGGFQVDSTASSGLLNFANIRFERSGFDSANFSTPTNSDAPGIRIRGRMNDCTFIGCNTDANHGFGLDIDKADTTRLIYNLVFVGCNFRRDGAGTMATQGEYAGVRIRGLTGSNVEKISFSNCIIVEGKADDAGGVPAYTHPKYGLWAEYTGFLQWVGGNINSSDTANRLYGGTGGWSTLHRPMFVGLTGNNAPTTATAYSMLPQWSSTANRPAPVFNGLIGLNTATNTIEVYSSGAWRNATGTAV